jgi:BirA family biotin operon repressor/biotin-[acetyl-CoA-carboxylase] ligase
MSHGWDAASLASALGVPVVAHVVVDSTMTTAESDPRPRVVHLAERQRSGQGRHGRLWSSPPGNLYATIAWTEEDPLPPAILSAIQIAWCEAIAEAGGPRTRCKWPNDGLVAGGKWAGLLARRSGAPYGGRLLVGLGANLECSPAREELDPESAPVAALADHWRPWPGKGAVGRLLLGAAVGVLREGTAGVAGRLARWPVHDALEIGAPLRLEDASGERTGLYRGLTPDGRMRLAMSQGEILVAAGDVRRVRPTG